MVKGVTKFLSGWFLSHWKVLGLVLIAVLALASGVYAYWRFNTRTPSAPYTASVWPPLELRMELDKTQFQLGEMLTIRLFLKNINDANVKIAFSEGAIRLGFLVLDENGSVVFKMPLMTVESVEEVSLEPNGQISRVREWYQIGNIPNEYYEKQVPMGIYTIIGRTSPILSMPGYDLPPPSPRRGSDPPLRRIETPPIMITIA